MRSLFLILFIIGIVLVIIGYYENNKPNSIDKIEYRYIPRNYLEEQMFNTNLKNKYSDLFDKSSIWSTYPFSTDKIVL